ncbi:MAG: energy transducer TonB [Burkholderiaceae bacterium]|nr:energy transducer TonB [Burkholderiaceae bacterium]
MRIDLNPEPPAPHAVAEEAAVDDFLLQGATASKALNASAGRQWTTWWVVLAVSVHAVVIGGVLYLKPTMFKMDAARTSDSADKALPVEWIGQAPPIVAVPSPPLPPRVAPQTPPAPAPTPVPAPVPAPAPVPVPVPVPVISIAPAPPPAAPPESPEMPPATEAERGPLAATQAPDSAQVSSASPVPDVTPSQAPNQSENENRVGETTAQRVLPQVITARRVAPIYPATSRRRSEEGDVVLDVLVGADGRVTQITVAGSSDFERLDKAAVAAVQQWRFVPGRVAGEPQAMRLRVPIRFQLR